MTQRIVLYGTAICPMVPPVRGMLARADAEFEYVNISRDETARKLVREINGGNESVPTLVFPDGSTLTEPSGAALREKLVAFGYAVPEPTPMQRGGMVLQSPGAVLLSAFILLLAYLLKQPILTAIGAVCLAGTLIVGYLARRSGP